MSTDLVPWVSNSHRTCYAARIYHGPFSSSGNLPRTRGICTQRARQGSREQPGEIGHPRRLLQYGHCDRCLYAQHHADHVRASLSDLRMNDFY